MEFTRKTRKSPRKVISDNLSEIYPHDLQMYNTPPGNEITLTEFEDLAQERAQLFKILEQATKNGHKTYSEHWLNTVKINLRKQRLIKFLDLLEPSPVDVPNFQARRADHISHFILRLVYCRSDDLRRWFLAREQEWFKIRFRQLKPEAVKAFLDINKFIYKPISEEEKQNLRTQLSESTEGINDVDTTTFYKVKFSEVVCTLVRNRRVFLLAGFAYIPDFQLVTCVLSVFTTELSIALASASHKIPILDDARLNYLLSNIETNHISRDYAASDFKGIVKIQHLNRYSREHYPLCMRHIHETFRAAHHLKYGCRMQYSLFLKGIGVSYDDVMIFWHEEFTKLMDENTFVRKYSYLIKHNFGKAGSKIDYPPYNCRKIISNGVGFGEHHGCPFRHFSITNLKEKLSEYGIRTCGVKEILQLVEKKQFELACTKYFEYTHGQPSKTVVNHPNQYFENSRAVTVEIYKSTKKIKLLPATAKVEDIWGEECEV